MSMRILATLALAALVLAGCTQYALVPPSRTTVQNAFTVEPARAWNRWNFTFEKVGPYEQAQADTWNGPVETWVAEGYGLDRMVFVGGLPGGASLIKGGNEKEPLPLFREDMTPSEVMEFVEATLARAGQTAIIETKNLRPVQFGGRPGFRFDVYYVRRDDEVDTDGTVIGTVKDKKLYLIFFSGTRLYHYKKLLPEVERLVDTVKFVS